MKQPLSAAKHPVVRREMRAVLPPGFAGWLRGFDMRCFDRHPNVAGRVARWRCRGSPLRKSDTVWGVDRSLRMEAGDIRAVMKPLSRGLHEFVLHPRGTTPDAELETLLQLREPTA